jgi:hypothetical protein
MHGTIAGIAVLMQIEGKEIFVVGKLLRHLYMCRGFYYDFKKTYTQFRYGTLHLVSQCDIINARLHVVPSVKGPG